MKPVLLFCIFAQFASSLALWQPIIGLWRRFHTPRIPQFILDLNHDYINDNYASIDSLADPREALCNIGSSQRQSIPPVPEDLFARLLVDNTKADINGRREGWKNAKDRLTEMLDCPAALDTCDDFLLDIYNYHGGDYCDNYMACPDEPVIPPKEVPELLSQVLGSMPNLTSLQWARPYEEESTVAAFREVFSDREFSLPTLKTLRLGPNLEFLLPMASNIETLKPSRGYSWGSAAFNPTRDPTPESPQWKLINATRELKHLTHFEMDTVWTRDIIKTLHDAAPGLTSLSMNGTLVPERWQTRIPHWYADLNENASGYTQGDALKKALPLLASFQNLTTLHLPYAENLGFSVPQGSGCGNAYFSSDGAKMGRREILGGIVAAEKAARVVVPELPRLETLCIASSCVKTGDKPLRWSWTDRVREFLLEGEPRWKQSPGEEPDEDPEGPVFWTWEEDEKWLVDGELADLF